MSNDISIVSIASTHTLARPSSSVPILAATAATTVTVPNDASASWGPNTVWFISADGGAVTLSADSPGSISGGSSVPEGSAGALVNVAGGNTWALTVGAPTAVVGAATWLTNAQRNAAAAALSSPFQPDTVGAIEVPVPVASGGTGATTAAAARANLQALGPVFTPEQFGAVGDGSDEYAELQAMINAAEAAGGVAMLTTPPTAWGIATKLVIDTARTSLIGDGSLPELRALAGLGNQSPAVQVSADYCRVAGIRITNPTGLINASSAITARSVGIFVDASHCTIDGNEIDGWQHGVIVAAADEDHIGNRICDNDILNCLGEHNPALDDRADGIMSFGAFTTITGNYVHHRPSGFTEPGRIGIHVEGLSSVVGSPTVYASDEHGAVVANNIVVGPWLKGVASENIHNPSITGNTVDGARWVGIPVTATAYTGGAVTGNTVVHRGPTSGGFGTNKAGIWLGLGAATEGNEVRTGNFTCTGNTIEIRGTAGAGIHVIQTGTAPADDGEIIIANNAIASGVFAADDNAFNFGINGTSARTVVITGNTIRGTALDGINLFRCERALIHGNILRDIGRRGIDATGNSSTDPRDDDAVKIADNIFVSVADELIRVYYHSGVLIDGNIARGCTRPLALFDCSDVRVVGNVVKEASSTVSVSSVTTYRAFANDGIPASTAAYSATNVTTDRAFDANATTLDELADVVGTLIADLKTYGLLQ